MAHELTVQELEKFSADFNKNPENQVVARAAQRSGVLEASYNDRVQSKLTRVFSTELDTDNVTNQKHSGRCWEFATLNVLRHAFGKKYKAKNFTFSQAYNFFWDKIERANMFYNRILASANMPLDSRQVKTDLDFAGTDGGQFQMAAALVEKYGVVPSYAMPETFNTNDTTGFATALGDKLKKDALVLRELKQYGKEDEIKKTREKFLSQVYQMTAIAVGEPPKKFDLEYRDDDKKYHLDKNLTPLEFLHKYLGDVDFDDYVVLTNAPDHEYDKLYGLPAEDNIAGSIRIKLLNVPMEYLSSAAIAQLKDGEAVWFGNDVLRQMNRKSGYLDTNLYKLDDLFGVDLQMSKADRLRTGVGQVSHAMTLVGVDEDNGDVRQWKVENSWGDKSDAKGFYVMNSDWFKDYVYEVVVHKKYLTKKQQELAEGPITDLPAWDSLA
ncbi:C1 family peptidase [Lactobacillus kefiranofaciens subsp. kefirgranum]|uniref:C1 family peptidase n=1 Tax=Lactobacillus kefiranofaciens TaxID=267818 RepID=UPI0006D1E193|nr:C1 family peptidase [Lactobacillus kefiranofaciens]KRL30531.1 aminopeptidase E [Lactobacillus kefiranofaciens subsp. kefirgranum DSM 10550 = JCM 8572]MDF4143075.1 C1 family peptidase [Lactobacillus kefiranofaciens]PAK97873.1 aminopeptidase [Lactobacillus kefiranofaciens]URW71301.1 C1 family peptidase [Lactobacillus kefiranofaciens subsp. kefirgranum]URW73248.1 C1 family peptidase [Lactobacillus kefiranofaciens subsp. kefirgranum]